MAIAIGTLYLYAFSTLEPFQDYSGGHLGRRLKGSLLLLFFTFYFLVLLLERIKGKK
jgi:hypothetical protein